MRFRAFPMHSAAHCIRRCRRRKNRGALWSRKINRTIRFQPWLLISGLPNDLFPHTSSCDCASPAVIFQCNAVTAARYLNSLSSRKKNRGSFFLAKFSNHWTYRTSARSYSSFWIFFFSNMPYALNAWDAISMKVAYFLPTAVFDIRSLVGKHFIACHISFY